MKKRAPIAFLSLFLLAACARSTPNASGFIAIPPCPVPQPPPAMLYPVSGATSVPDGNFALVYAFIYGTSVWLAPTSGGPAVGTTRTAVPSPLPSPAVTPEPGDTPAAYAVPTLQSHMTYNVYSKFTPIDTACTASDGLVGSFTTQ